MFFKRSKAYSRAEALEVAAKAERRGKTKKAITGYLAVLEKDPKDLAVHAKVAPLLAKKKRYGEAWKSFKIAGESYTLDGFGDKALSVYTQATRCMPMEIETWKAVSKLQRERGLNVDSVNTLLKGHRNFKSRKLRPAGVYMLRKAWKIIPWHFEVTFELARLLAKTGKKEEALELLEGLSEREGKKKLRRIRGTIFRISPGPRSAWRWLRAALGGS